MAGYWLKLYTEILDDPKYFRLSDAAKLGMVELMLVAKKTDKDGSLPCIDDIAFFTRRSVEWWAPVIKELITINYLVEDGEDITIRKFSERQAAIENAERMKQSRIASHKKEFSHEPDTEMLRNETDEIKSCDEPVTNLLRNVTEIKETESETESEGEREEEEEAKTEKIRRPASASPQPSNFPYDVSLRRYQTMLMNVTGNMYVPPDQSDYAVPMVQAIERTVGEKDLMDYLKNFWQAWRDRGYSKTNYSWLEWAVAGETPSKNGSKQEKAKTFAERLAES